MPVLMLQWLAQELLSSAKKMTSKIPSKLTASKPADFALPTLPTLATVKKRLVHA